jgi:AraC-like DNA-binding protein
MSVSILMVRELLGALERRGVARSRFLRAANIEPAQLDDSSLRVSFGAYARVLHAVLEVSGDPAFGLHLGEHLNGSGFHVFGPMVQSSASLRQSYEVIARYSRLMAEFPSPSLCEDGGLASIRYDLSNSATPELRLVAEFVLTGLLQLLRRFAGANALPRRACFQYPAPAYRAEYTRVFGGRECFAEAFTGIEFDRSWLDRAQLHTHPELYAVLESHAERELGRLDRDTLVARRAEEYLTVQDPRHLPTMDQVARELGMSARSLRRRLAAEGVSYKSLVERARTRIAQRLLENPSASIQEVAYAMGFATPAAFHRAFKRWTATTPKSYRASY